jgi:hypothetical protein
MFFLAGRGYNVTDIILTLPAAPGSLAPRGIPAMNVEYQTPGFLLQYPMLTLDIISFI